MVGEPGGAVEACCARREARGAKLEVARRGDGIGSQRVRVRVLSVRRILIK
jgi:hypothetical protein